MPKLRVLGRLPAMMERGMDTSPGIPERQGTRISISFGLRAHRWPSRTLNSKAVDDSDSSNPITLPSLSPLQGLDLHSGLMH